MLSFCRCLGTFKVECGVFFQEMVPAIQSFPAELTQIGSVQLVTRPQGLRMRISDGIFDHLYYKYIYSIHCVLQLFFLPGIGYNLHLI